LIGALSKAGYDQQSSFAFSALNIIYPSRDKPDYGLSTLTLGDCYTAAFKPEKLGDDVENMPSVYSFSPKKLRFDFDTLTAGSIVIVGSDGGWEYLARYLNQYLLKQYEQTKIEGNLDLAYEVLTYSRSLGISDKEQEEQAIYKILSILSVSIPLRNLQDIQKLTLEMNQSEMRPFDDVTLLLGYLPTQPASSEKAE